MYTLKRQIALFFRDWDNGAFSIGEVIGTLYNSRSLEVLHLANNVPSRITDVPTGKCERNMKERIKTGNLDRGNETKNLNEFNETRNVNELTETRKM